MNSGGAGSSTFSGLLEHIPILLASLRLLPSVLCLGTWPNPNESSQKSQRANIPRGSPQPTTDYCLQINTPASCQPDWFTQAPRGPQKAWASAHKSTLGCFHFLVSLPQSLTVLSRITCQTLCTKSLSQIHSDWAIVWTQHCPIQGPNA